MAVPDTDDTNSSNSLPSSSPQSARPSWETAPRPTPAPQPAPRSAPTYSAPSASPYYAAPAAAPPPISAPSATPAAPAYASDTEDVQYDLAGNPIPSSAPAAASPTLAAPYGYAAANAAPGVWPPPANGGPQYGGPQYGAQAYRNNSGEQSHLPPELEKLHWHWGAFFFPILWTKKHGLTTVAAMLTGGLIFLRVLRVIAASISPAVFLGICVLYGLSYFGLQVFCGFNGHKIGWRNRHFPGGVEEYFKVQNAWMWWGFGVNVVLGPLLAFGAFAAIAQTLAGTTPHQYQPYSNGASGYSSGSNGYGSSNGSYGSGSNNGYGKDSNNGYGKDSSAGQ